MTGREDRFILVETDFKVPLIRGIYGVPRLTHTASKSELLKTIRASPPLTALPLGHAPCLARFNLQAVIGLASGISLAALGLSGHTRRRRSRSEKSKKNPLDLTFSG
jgi:hypothetical protein